MLLLLLLQSSSSEAGVAAAPPALQFYFDTAHTRRGVGIADTKEEKRRPEGLHKNTIAYVTATAGSTKSLRSNGVYNAIKPNLVTT